MPRPLPPLPPTLIYGVAERFLGRCPDDLGNRFTADALAEWLTAEGYPRTREQIFPIVRQAIDHNFLTLCPPRSEAVRQRLAQAFPSMPADAIVVDARAPTIQDNLGTAAADRVFELINQVYAQKNAALEKDNGGQNRRTRGGDPPVRVHIGLGAGATTHPVAEKLARRLHYEPDVPPLTIHALSSGFSVTHPLSSPVAYFSFFTELGLDIEFVGLFSSPVVKWAEYEETKKLPGIKEGFAAARKIDIVVTSLAHVSDPHGLLNVFLNENGGKQAGLDRAGHVGDVLMNPYSNEGPLTVNTGIRAVTLFDLPGLAALVAKGKHVVLVVGPCNKCQNPKTLAVRPLLTQASLRVCNHVVIDIGTARDLLGESPRPG